MKKYTSSKITRSGMIVALLLTIGGCTTKPPGCEDAETIKTIDKMVMDSVLESQSVNGSQANIFFGVLTINHTVAYVVNNKKSIIELHDLALQKYKEGIKTTLTGVTSDGYNEQARKHSCKATLQISSSASNKIMTAKSLEYTVQATSVKNEFLVNAQDLDQFIDVVKKDAMRYITDSVSKSIRNAAK